tara:strand:- start:203 stop:793 length:591 start_codon:yes stop_codon:yes gene_type:complete
MVINIIITILMFISQYIDSWKEEMTIDQVKPGDVIIWKQSFKSLEFPIPNHIQFLCAFTGLTHAAIVGNDGYVFHSIYPHTYADYTGDDRYHYHEKLTLSEFSKTFKGSHRRMLVHQIKHPTYLKELDYVNMKAPPKNFLENIHWLLTEPSITNLDIIRQYKLSEGRYNCLFFVSEIQKINNIKRKDYGKRKRLIL